MTTWAFIYEHPGSDPNVNRHVLELGGQRTVLVPVPAPSAAPAVAEALIAEGVQLLELCGGFPLAVAASVRAVVPDYIPVGHVAFAADSVLPAAAYAAGVD